MRTPVGAPPRRAVRLPPGRSDAVHGAEPGTSKMLSRPPSAHAAGADPRTLAILRDKKPDSSPGASTAAFLAAAIVAKLLFAFAAPVAGAAHVPPPGTGRESPM